MDDEMKRELISLRAELRSEFRSGLAGVDSRLSSVESEMVEVKTLLRKLVAAVANISSELADFRMEFTVSRADTARLKAQVVSFTGEIDTSRRERILADKAYMLHQRTLDRHEKRLARLEARRA